MQIDPNPNKINFLFFLYTKYSELMTGGIVAMHKLAYEVASRGHNVYMLCDPEYPHENIKKINSEIINTDGFVNNVVWENFTFNYLNTVSIYPQVTWYNPFNTEHVVRWILYDTEKVIEDTYGLNDEYFYYGDFKTFQNRGTKKLTVFDYQLDKLYVTNHNKRKGFCHIIHKHTPINGENIFSSFNSFDLTDWKTKGGFDYLRDKLNEYEYFLTYDQKSFYSVAATLCGTKSIILNAGPSYEFAPNANTQLFEKERIQTATEYRLNNPIQMFGVAYGLDDISWANETIQFSRNHIEQLEVIDKKTIDRFIEYWENKLMIQV